MKKIVYISVMVVLFTSFTATAQNFEKGRWGHRGKRFEYLDTDQNGKVTLEEMRVSVLKFWKQADLNQDGTITREEISNFAKGSLGKRFLNKDANGDGMLSREEVEWMPQLRFDQIDEDKDGFLSQTELKRHHPRMRHKPHNRKEKRFNIIDINGDGRVTLEELEEHVKDRFESLDLDGDGVVTKDEMKQCTYRGGNKFSGQK